MSSRTCEPAACLPHLKGKAANETGRRVASQICRTRRGGPCCSGCSPKHAPSPRCSASRLPRAGCWCRAARGPVEHRWVQGASGPSRRLSASQGPGLARLGVRRSVTALPLESTLSSATQGPPPPPGRAPGQRCPLLYFHCALWDSPLLCGQWFWCFHAREEPCWVLGTSSLMRLK